MKGNGLIRASPGGRTKTLPTNEIANLHKFRLQLFHQLVDNGKEKRKEKGRKLISVSWTDFILRK